MDELRKRIIELRIRLPMNYPKDWDDDTINFHLNEGSWCMDNIIDELKKYSETHGCICGICEGRVLKEAEV